MQHFNIDDPREHAQASADAKTNEQLRAILVRNAYGWATGMNVAQWTRPELEQAYIALYLGVVGYADRRERTTER